MTTSTSSLSAWLLEQIAADEATIPAMECHCPDEMVPGTPADRWPGCPDRVADECEAKRRIVEEHGLRRDVDDADYCDRCADWYGVSVMPQTWPCPTLRALALPYADRPGWQEEWR